MIIVLGGGSIESATANNPTTNHLPNVTGETKKIAKNSKVWMRIRGLLKNDTDIDGDKLVIKHFQKNSKKGGKVERKGKGNRQWLRYIPARNFTGIDHFKYWVSDGKGEVSGTVKIRVGKIKVSKIKVSKIIDELRAQPDSFQAITQNQAKEINVLANDEGISNNVTISVTSPPQNGDINISGQKVTYTPVNDYFGPDSFIYRIKDKEKTASANVSLNIECTTKCTGIFKLSWQPSTSDITGYKVFYGVEEDKLDQFVELGNVITHDHSVNTKGEYFFAVLAVNHQGIESELTEVVSGVF